MGDFRVLAVGNRVFGGGVMWSNKLIGQVTKCRTLDGVTFYVREACNAIPSFVVSSNERWGDKQDGPGRERQSLELCAPAGEWDRIAEIVRGADRLGRPVRQNEQFTATDAERCLAQSALGESEIGRAVRHGTTAQ